MKKFGIAIICLMSTCLVACWEDYSDVEAKAEYYYNRLNVYRTIEHTVGLSAQDEMELQAIEDEIDDYLSTLSSDEREAWYKKGQELMNK